MLGIMCEYEQWFILFSSTWLLQIVVRNIIFPRMLVCEWEAGRGWTTSGRLVAACVVLRLLSKCVECG